MKEKTFKRGLQALAFEKCVGCEPKRRPKTAHNKRLRREASEASLAARKRFVEGLRRGLPPDEIAELRAEMERRARVEIDLED